MASRPIQVLIHETPFETENPKGFYHPPERWVVGWSEGSWSGGRDEKVFHYVKRERGKKHLVWGNVPARVQHAAVNAAYGM